MDIPVDDPDFEAVLRLQRELKGESPRGIVLISAAMLEDALRGLLLSYLVPNPSSSDSIFDGPTAPFASFSAKIDAAYRLSLVSDRFCRDLHVIRRIRNDVAHRPSGFTFSDPSPRERVLSLSKSHGLFERSPRWVEQHGSPSLQDQFLEASSWMLFFLIAERERRAQLRSRSQEFGYVATLDEPGGLPKQGTWKET